LSWDFDNENFCSAELGTIEVDLDLESLTSLDGTWHDETNFWLLMHVEGELGLVSLGTLKGLDSNGDHFKINTNKVSRWNGQGISVEINAFQELFDIINTLSDGPVPLEGTSHSFVPSGSQNKVLHRILETSLEFFSGIVGSFTEGSGVEKITIIIARLNGNFSGILSLSNFLIVHQVFLILLGAPNNLKSWVVVHFTGTFTRGIDDGFLSVLITTLGTVTVLLEEESWSAGFAAFLTGLAHTGKGNSLELLDLSQDISRGLVLVSLKLFSVWHVVTVLVSLVTESTVGSVSGEESELLLFLLLLLISSLLGLGEKLLNVAVHLGPFDGSVTIGAGRDAGSLLINGVDGEVLASTALVALIFGLAFATSCGTSFTVQGSFVSEGTLWANTDGESFKSFGDFTGLVTGFDAFLLSVEPSFRTSTTATVGAWLADTSEIFE
jgi:hypothetical protein